MSKESKKYQENFKRLEKISEELSSNDVEIDKLIEKGKIATSAAKECIKILKEEKGKFKTLEEELENLSEEIESVEE
jgi:exonuclease VII small subunit